MKVDVVTVDSPAKFHRFSWWSNWIDICVFDFGYSGYLLQMAVSRRNAKKFRCAGMSGSFSAAQCTISQAGNLTQMAAEE